MSDSALMVVLAVAAAALLGLLLRGGSTAPPAAMGTSPQGPEAADEEPEADPAGDAVGDEAAGEVAAVTSDGWAFVPVGDRNRVRLVPPRTAQEPAGPGKPVPEQLGRGDLVAARIKRGAPDHDPWRLEALGRDHEYRAWRFENEEAAQAALELVGSRVVRAPRDEYGEPVAIGDRDFDEARRRGEEIEAELATMPDVLDPEPPPPRAPLG